MKKLAMMDVVQALAKALGKPCVYISHSNDDWNIQEMAMAAPYLSYDTDGQLFHDEQGIIICENEEEMQKIFMSTIGEDGPNKINPYNGKSRWYAIGCDANGNLLSENT